MAEQVDDEQVVEVMQGDEAPALVERGARSSLYATREGHLYRQYHDSGVWTGPLAGAAARHSSNRTVASLVARAWEEEEAKEEAREEAKEEAREEESVYRGERDRRRPPAPHERHAFRTLVYGGVGSVDAFARACGVKRSTAWSYACRVVELWPADAAPAARRLVHPSVLAACQRRAGDAALRGPLRNVLRTLEAEDLARDRYWHSETEDDKYAHLRLARLLCCASS